jgi:hypothetical protein
MRGNFRGSHRSGQFLRYVVNRSVSGHCDELKERLIAGACCSTMGRTELRLSSASAFLWVPTYLRSYETFR